MPGRPTPVPEVLFVCVHNAGRSQMAAALLEHHARGPGPRALGRHRPGLGDQPRGAGGHGRARHRRAGLGRATPKRLTDEAVRASDVVVTMGCGDECPFYPGRRYEDWALDDPAGRPLDEVRPIRDEIDRRVQRLLGELLAEPDTPG